MASDLPGDVIHIRDLRLRCIIGTLPQERTQRQDVVINLAMHADLSRAGRSDDLADTVDYKTIKERIVALVEASECQLVERLGELIAQACLESPGVQAVRVLVEKPGALRFARTVGVEIFRTR